MIDMTGRPAIKPKSDFARNMAMRRKVLGWSGMELAERAGIGYHTVRDIEAGITPGREENRSAIATALGCTLADLYSNEYHNPLSAEDIGRAVQSLLMAPIVRQTVALYLLTRDKAYLSRLPDKLRRGVESLNLD